MAFMASQPNRLFQAREVAQKTAITQPTVSKLLKRLSKHDLLRSERGTQGGYQLNCNPNQISIVDLIDALEGPIAITECSLGHDHCDTASSCTIKTPWLRINHAITHALQKIKLADLYQAHPYPLSVGAQHG